MILFYFTLYATVSIAVFLTSYLMISVIFWCCMRLTLLLGSAKGFLAAPASALCGWKGVKKSPSMHCCCGYQWRPPRRSPAVGAPVQQFSSS